jgi:hypothetical protein
MLTLRKAMERDMYFHKPGKRIVAVNRTKANPRSLMILVRGVTAEPNSESGLGRRATLYALRAKGASVKHANIAPKASTKTSKTSAPKAKTSTKSQTPTSDALDRIHAALAAPEPAPAAVTVPAVTIAPEAPAPVAPEAAPAPVATESANAETATPVAAPVSTLVNS